MLPPPKPPFTDFRYEKPGEIRKITLKDLPAPFATPSAGNSPKVVARPEGAWPQVPEGFKVEQYATGLDNPRIIRTAPNGDFFVAETKAGDIRVFRGITSNGKPEQMAVFASGLNGPSASIFIRRVRIPSGSMSATRIPSCASPIRMATCRRAARRSTSPTCPAAAATGRATFNSRPTARKCLSPSAPASNVDDPDTTPGEKNRADVLEFNPGRLRHAGFRLRHSQLRGPGHQSKDRRVMVLGQRTRRLGRQSGSRLHHPRAGGRLLRLALVVHGRPSGSAARGQTSRTEGQSHHPGRDRCIPHIASLE